MTTTGAGHLMQRVAWDKRLGGEDGAGNSEGDFREQFETRAGYTFLRGTETVIASRLEGRQPIVVRVRASVNSRQIDTGWRMRDTRNGQWAGQADPGYWWDGPVYAVRSVALTDDRQWIDVMVESGVAA